MPLKHFIGRIEHLLLKKSFGQFSSVVINRLVSKKTSRICKQQFLFSVEGQSSCASSHHVGRGTGFIRTIAGACPWRKIWSMSSRYLLNYPGLVSYLLSQRTDVFLDLFVGIVSQDLCYKFGVCVFFMGADDGVKLLNYCFRSI